MIKAEFQLYPGKCDLLRRVIDCSQQRTEYAYDRHGYLASVTNTLGETTRTQHDKMGRRIATQLPDGLY